MKKTIQLFMIAAALFVSGNLFAQSASNPMTVPEYQNRLHDLMLCHNYLSTILTQEQMATVENEITAIEGYLQSVNAQHLPMSPFDNLLISNPTDANVMAYLKILALYSEPMFLLGHDLSPSEKTLYLNTLTSRSAAITSANKF